MQTNTERAKAHYSDMAELLRLRELLKEYVEAFQSIVNMIDAPHFSHDRKHRIRSLARSMVAKSKD